MDTQIKEIFIQHGVTLKKASASYMSALNTVGTLSFAKYDNRDLHLFMWEQTAVCDILDTESQDSGWSLVDTVESTSSVPPIGCDDNAQDSFAKADAELNEETLTNGPSASSKQAKVSIQVFFRDLKGVEVSKTELRLLGADAIIHSAYQFNHSSPQILVGDLERRGFVRKSSRRKHFYHCLEETDHEKLQKSFSELNIEDIRNRPRPNLYIDIMSKLANVHNQILPLGGTRHHVRDEGRSRSSTNGSDASDCNENATVVTRQPSSEAKTNKLIPRPDVHRGLPLDVTKWTCLRLPDGSISEPDLVKSIIFRGGITDDIRAEVWKYLLGLDIWEHTAEQRDGRRASKTQEYFQMKLQWLTITPTQEHNFTGYRERKCQIEKDVKRTDRTYEFFAGDDNPNLSKLQDILMTYVMYNFDLGYVQGMSDLLAPILSLVQNEAESFWCFVGFMGKVFNNFDIDQKGMKQQLEHLRTLLAFVNERLYNYLKDNQSENMYFCFRWLLVWFKREFSNSDIMQLWEILWTGQPCPNFHLFICVAILDQEMDVFMDGQFTFTEILKHVNELSGNLNLQAVLEQAESIYLQVKGSLDASKEPHTELRKLIGEKVSPDGGTASGSGTGSDEDDDSCMSIVNEKSSEDLEAKQRKVEEACDISMSYSFF